MHIWHRENERYKYIGFNSFTRQYPKMVRYSVGQPLILLGVTFFLEYIQTWNAQLKYMPTFVGIFLLWGY